MAKHGMFKRYMLILEKLNQSNFPSFNDIKEYLCEWGFDISYRTLQRDIEQIRNEFGVELEYSKQHRGYFVNQEKGINLDQFFNFMEIAKTANLLNESLSENKQSLNYINFDRSNKVKGLEYIPIILRAIKQEKWLKLRHYHFLRGYASDRRLSPYLLKEYQNRWYVLGIDPQYRVSVFALDRIQQVELEEEKFIFDKEFQPNKVFDKRIGVSGLEYSQVEEVILSYSCEQAMYIKTLPIHHSQKILIDNEEELRISIEVVINYELMMEILKRGADVKVIQPQHLAQEIQNIYCKALSQYET